MDWIKVFKVSTVCEICHDRFDYTFTPETGEVNLCDHCHAEVQFNELKDHDKDDLTFL